ncbi:MAG: excinuclease ABC subunit UvrC [Clostridiales bacterium]|jgi:excinuclease ABC subunit C|nr:excinuclease ABC subunit UvrC [Clostridiales bacterium]
MFDIHEELKKLPRKPGVYLMKNEDGLIIYVGKALNLANRVRQYFQSPSGHTPKVRGMTPHIREFEYVVTDNEVEALILECNLIKKHNPKYNVMLKDDKAYPYIKLTVNEAYPRVLLARRHDRDKAKYFGPYTSAGDIRESLDLIRKIWPLRSCMRKLPHEIGKGRPCLNHHIGGCKAPCAGLINESDYNKIVDEVLRFLSGKHETVKKRLADEMWEASENLEFERAAELRDRLSALETLLEKQKADTASGEDADVIAFARAHDEALFQVFFIRAGKIVGREHFMVNHVDDLSRQEVMTAFIKQFYAEAAFIPRELILENGIDDKDVITRWLAAMKGANVTVNTPQRGEKRELAELASKNAILTLEQFGEHIKREKARTDRALEEIKSALGLPAAIDRIEAYDISNIQGYESVGSMVAFENGKPKNSDYRKFKIKGVIGPDDYASMEETIGRRFNRYTAGDVMFAKLPDILFIDGGRGQVHAAEKAIAALNVKIPVCGMVKDDKHRTRGLWFQENEISLPTASEGFKLITRIQDEVHRFAVEYHRKLRADAQTHSLLDDINGIGPARRKALMRRFKSIENIRKADLSELEQADGMNKKAAEAVYRYFRQYTASR